jgi:hypothetical protein
MALALIRTLIKPFAADLKTFTFTDSTPRPKNIRVPVLRYQNYIHANV